MTGIQTSGRYLAVGATCAVLNSLILIGLDRVGIHYAVSSLIAFVVVVSVGYSLHSWFTFRVRRGLSTFALYAMALAANYPLQVLTLYLLVDLLRLPIVVASPISTLALAGWNVFATRWALVRRPVRQAGAISTDAVSAVLATYVPMYRYRKPVYQTVMLSGLRDLWSTGDRRVLDVGGGTGVVAQAVKELFPVEQVTSVDVVDRFLRILDVATATYDGVTLPFPDASFDCVLLANVIHHVPVAARVALLRECARVAGAGRLYIKDHEARSVLDRWRLAILDAVGNTAFGGQVRASYPARAEWDALAAAAGYEIEQRVSGDYRDGLFGFLFPNRLEISMRWAVSSPGGDGAPR
ncbi:MAG: GtrA family protein [Chloroflexota bacterium]